MPPVLQIDTHQHFWMYDAIEYAWIDDRMTPLRRDFLPADLKPELEQNRFQGSVAVQARQTLEETRWLLELAEGKAQIEMYLYNTSLVLYNHLHSIPSNIKLSEKIPTSVAKLLSA